MAKREFLMLAHTYKRGKHHIGGWFMSEKLDGMRCFWDGGISRGLEKSMVPWANCEKDKRYKSPPIATGLWSRLGNVIHAPDVWLDRLPKMPLDGELYTPGLARQDLMSKVKKIVPITKWTNIQFHIFDSPCLFTVFDSGTINTTNFKKSFDDMSRWIFDHGKDLTYSPKRDTQFMSTMRMLKAQPPVIVIPQVQLPYQTTLANKVMDFELNKISDQGGEGLMLRKPESFWTPARSHELLKVKKLDDDEGIVVGYITGRQTELGSKLLGLMGALILEIDGGKRLELSGFTDRERSLATVDCDDRRSAHSWAVDHPETECPDWIEAINFKRGDTVTFKYRGKTNDGIPTEARYWRKHDQV